MELAAVVRAHRDLRATSSRLEKRKVLVGVLGAAGDDLELVTTYLSGRLRQRRTGIGWAGLSTLPAPALTATLSVTEVDARMVEAAGAAGPGSASVRSRVLGDLMARATGDEQEFLRGLILGELRQGASDAAMLDAVAEAFDVPIGAVRRAAMLGGSTPEVAVATADGGRSAVDAFRLVVGRGVRPMLAASAATVAEAVAGFGDLATVWDAKLDGIRAQVHRRGDEVKVFTRSLEEISGRLPEVVDDVLTLPEPELVLDGEVLLIDELGRPRPFQETSARTASHHDRTHLRFYAFDLLAAGAEDLLDRPLRERRSRLLALVGTDRVVEHVETHDLPVAERFFTDVVSRGFEGVVGKSLEAPYAAGRRGSAWVKVKPRHTLDLVVTAVEWGSGRRRGFLSNIHLAARGDDEWVPVGKTFKGMTDKMLAWQTDRFLALETHREGHVVHVRPEQVVEIAFDGVQRSTRYPGGVALRFARVLRYRDDKPVAEADDIAAVRALGPH